MTIQLRSKPTDKLIELGGGARPQIRPNVDYRMCYDDQGNPTVDFTADFNEPLPIQSEEWDGVFSQFVIEHISWRKVRDFISEVHRILKPGGKAVLVTANTEAQMKWIQNRGWEQQEGKREFDACSCILFGDQDYPENTHRNYLSPDIAFNLFRAAGFVNVTIQPYGDVGTDMVIQAIKGSSSISVFASGAVVDNATVSEIAYPAGKTEFLAPTVKLNMETPTEEQKKELQEGVGQLFKALEKLDNQSSENIDEGNNAEINPTEEKVDEMSPKLENTMIQGYTREQLFDKVYFNGGHKVGGYTREGYWDYPVHEITAQHILNRKPESCLELGCARGYIVKRIQDQGIRCNGLEISQHCWMTRVTNGIIQHDICTFPWPFNDKEFDLCYTVSTFEHIPEKYLPQVIKEMERVSRRGLHGIDFGQVEDIMDRTHCTFHSREWWRKLLPAGHEVIDNQEMERGEVPQDVFKGDGKTKLNIGSFTTMYHHGWTNIDIVDLSQWAMSYGYTFQHADVRQGLKFNTESVDYIMLCHFLEHLSYDEGVSFLRRCRRIIKPNGRMRIQVPDATKLMSMCVNSQLSQFDEVNEGSAKSPTQMGKFWALIYDGHKAAYDYETLENILKDSSWMSSKSSFRQCPEDDGFRQILRETLDTHPELTLFVDAVPILG